MENCTKHKEKKVDGKVEDELSLETLEDEIMIFINTNAKISGKNFWIRCTTPINIEFFFLLSAFCTISFFF